MNEQELLKQFMRQSAQQVYVVTSKNKNDYSAITVSSLTSISMDPALMMISIDKKSHNHEILVNSDYFIITLLYYGDEEISKIMADKISAKEKLEKIGYIDSIYGPILNLERPYLILSKYKVYDGGDHSIILGKIIDGKVADIKCPLVYYNRNYTTLKNC
ncbi:MAG: flavin reductase family protein [Caldisphaera sp.]|jgi:flavin reductase (DIM6/NTAB) family NADH-FMN oxidoreductase RutF|uniref:flavin reductase family protein n=1 Tax=Caldisphaera sp. TaxID=2060322 RepID=UPI00397E8F87